MSGASILIEAVGPDAPGRSHPDLAPETDANGRFRAFELAPGRWLLRAITPDGAMAQIEIELIAEKSTSVEIAI